MESQSDGRQSSRSRLTQWNGPRTLVIPRTDRGFEFTLRHFIVYPPEPHHTQEKEYTSDDETEDLYFQRIQAGGLEPLDTIFVKTVRDGGSAQHAGLKAGDRIISVNGEPVTGKSYGQVIGLIQQSNADLSLLVVPKEEDILQLAYQNSGQQYDHDHTPLRDSTNSGYGSQSVKVSHYPSYPSHPSMDSSYPSSSSRDRKVLSTSSLDSRLVEGLEQYSRYDRDPPRRPLSTSTSYTSGLSIYREPPPDDNMNKNVFLDRRREFEARAAQENVNPNSSKTYSFGLYFPKKESRVNSAENLSRSVVIRRSKESVLQPTDSQENISKLTSSRARNVPIEYRVSGPAEQKAASKFRSQESLAAEEGKPPTRHGHGSSIRHSFPDSGVHIWSSPSRKAPDTSSPYSLDHATPTPDSAANKHESYPSNKHDSYPSHRQYVPVINESSVSRFQKMSASVDSIDPRSNVFHTEHHLRTAYNNNNTGSPEQHNQNQSSPSRTFILKIGEGQDRSSTPGVSQGASGQAGNQSYGAAFAVTRSPGSADIEIRKRGEPRILVSHRKKQFESREITPPPPTTPTNPLTTRYKSELEKMSSYRKYEGIQARLASFEKNTGSTEPVMRSRSQTPVSAQPISKVRRMSQERVKSPEPHTTPANTQISQGTSQSNYTDAAPIRIYVSQGSSNTSGSPIVEIVPMQSSSYQITDSRDRNSYSHDTSPDLSLDQTDADQSHKPVRKASFLSAVNAPYSRYLPQTGYDNETPSSDTTPKSSRVYSASAKTKPPLSQDHHHRSMTPASYGWAGHGTSPSRALSPSSIGSSLSISSTSPVPEGPGSVRLRNKPEISAEDFETKLHRRTSYLMATAKDRSTASLTMTSPSSTAAAPAGTVTTSASGPLDPNTPATLSKHKSMRKLKDFFGEKTPKIVEATEKRQDPASPIQEVTREGSLCVKMDVIDGKRASDRSWRPVWAVLRGHAMYLCKEKRDPANASSVFSYEEQPISVKSCIVDIAHGYTKKKNVFRMKTYNGCEYLLQAEDQDDMLAWIDAIKGNSNPDADSNGVTSAELIIRKSQEIVESAVPTKTSPPPSQKMGKKLSVLSIKQKMPHSPNLNKRRKTSTEKDDSVKPKTWKGKIGKSFKKQFGSSPSPAGNIPTVQEVGGMFGVPLEDCTPSPNNEFVPLLVDLCTQIVEAKGLEMTGVYRIPGNKAAVTLLQEEFNKGIESMNLEHEKWSDVNVISSLLKSFFRQLPEPLIPDDLYQPFVDANRIESGERRMLKLKRLIHELPEHHFETFKHLARHLNKVALYGHINRMEAKNLAIVFGPTLIRKADDNMIAMFTDMSDHCKIIESIVLHCDWFFGSWDMDNYVPTDEDATTECTSSISAVTSSSREDLEINPREIVCSIVEAANRKLRGESLEKRVVSVSETTTTSYNERNIDQEIIRRTKQIDTTSRSSPNLAAMQRTSDIIKTSSQEVVTDRRMAKSQEFCDREFPDFDYIDSDKDTSSAYLTPTTRYFSDELLDKNDELEVSHEGQSGSYRLSRETLDSLRRIELEARALREREERRQRDREQRQLEKQRIEADILATQAELENEERHSVDDLLHAVSTDTHTRKHDTPYRPSSTNKYSARDSGGKYFVIKGNSGSSGDRLSRPPRQASIESLVKQSKRTSSLENIESHSHGRAHGRPLAHVRARKGDQDRAKQDSSEIRYRGGSIKRSNSLRRGSLDSLIDLIEKRDNRMSWASTDSEEGFDLLTTLTSTFDQKLLTLSSQKAAQSQGGLAPPRRIPYTSSSGSLTSTAGTDPPEPPTVVSAQHRLPPQVPLSMVSKPATVPDLPAKQFRDPSLHRTPPKADAKIGLATRFERSTTHNPMYEGSGDSAVNTSLPSGDNYSLNLQSDLTFSVDNVSQGGRVGDGNSRVSSVMVVISSPSIMSADSQQSTYSIPHFISKPVTTLSSAQQKWDVRGISSPARTEYRPITKSEKTEVNVKLSQNGDKNKNTVLASKLALHDNQKSSGKSRSESPPPGNRRRSEKRKRRRHTVGGTSDSEHMNAVNEARKAELRLSAWEQLRPAVSQSSNIGPHSSMLSWLRNERLRGSSPDLTFSITDKNNAKRN